VRAETTSSGTGRRHEQRARVAALRRPLLILHAPNDDTVGIDNASRIFLAARHPKSFISLDDADHLLTKERDTRDAGNVIAAWCRLEAFLLLG
jgi:fermentation-respiration switch protein FrsA (DUF1100 family)